ncbi:PASTA domain-containing protein [Kitasatospora sp. NPDC048540]|uniref:PASTA domain-containing protein n=1 Tax=Kitasatospora sp. NPDC048540 TaxID=3155634 RepID=UPI0033F7BD3D
MTRHEPQPSGCAEISAFEQELVDAMNDFADTSGTPRFDATAIRRRARRKPLTAGVGLAVTIAVIGGGTALAAVSGSPQNPAAGVNAAASDTPSPLPSLPGNPTRIVQSPGQVVPRPGYATVPAVIGRDVASLASDSGRMTGLKVGKVTEQDGCTQPAGTVIAQSPPPVTPVSPGVGRLTEVQLGSAIDVIVCSAAGAPGQAVLPALVGRTVDDAKRILTGTPGLTLGVITDKPDDCTAPAGVVVAQSLREGRSVDLTVCG